MKKTADLTKRVLFTVKWRFMPQQKKYAYLWAKTLKALSQSNVQRNEEADEIIGG